MRRWALRRARIKHIPRTVMPFLRPGDLPTVQIFPHFIAQKFVNSERFQTFDSVFEIMLPNYCFTCGVKFLTSLAAKKTHCEHVGEF